MACILMGSSTLFLSAQASVIRYLLHVTKRVSFNTADKKKQIKIWLSSRQEVTGKKVSQVSPKEKRKLKNIVHFIILLDHKLIFS